MTRTMTPSKANVLDGLKVDVELKGTVILDDIHLTKEMIDTFSKSTREYIYMELVKRGRVKE